MPLCKQCFSSESNESSMSSVIGVSSVYSVIHNVNSDTSPSSLSSVSSASSLRSNASSISGVIFLNEWRVGANNHSKQKPSGVEFALHEMEVEGKKVVHFLFLFSSTRSSYIHPDLLVTHQHKIFQVNNFRTTLNQFEDYSD